MSVSWVAQTEHDICWWCILQGMTGTTSCPTRVGGGAKSLSDTDASSCYTSKKVVKRLGLMMTPPQFPLGLVRLLLMACVVSWFSFTMYASTAAQCSWINIQQVPQAIVWIPLANWSWIWDGYHTNVYNVYVTADTMQHHTRSQTDEWSRSM